jgi:predicted ATP-grasp superfamily ATP-dependent carboligase
MNDLAKHDAGNGRILLSEGTSTSAREAMTALGLSGYEIEVCDPAPWCLARFSRFLKRFHPCPGMGEAPAAYMDFVARELSQGRIGVLLPIHEQGLLFAKMQSLLPTGVAVALPSFQNYCRVLSKTGFDALLQEMELPRPPTSHARSARQLRELASLPCVIKLPIGTASRGIWLVHDETGLETAMSELDAAGAFQDVVLVQRLITGATEHAQAVFCQGRLVGIHMYRQLARGAGGGPARKESLYRRDVEGHLEKIGKALAWHGALSVDYILSEEDGLPRYIDCNPRLVEPMSAWFAGADLADLLVRVSVGHEPQQVIRGKAGVRTHLSLQALLGCGQQTGSRLALAAECWRLLRRTGAFAGSREELTPWLYDKWSVLPVVMTALLLLVRPSLAHELPRRGWGKHLITAKTMEFVERPVCL